MTPSTIVLLLIIAALAVLAIRRLTRRGLCDCHGDGKTKGSSSCAGCAGCGGMNNAGLGAPGGEAGERGARTGGAASAAACPACAMAESLNKACPPSASAPRSSR